METDVIDCMLILTCQDISVQDVTYFLGLISLKITLRTIVFVTLITHCYRCSVQIKFSYKYVTQSLHIKHSSEAMAKYALASVTNTLSRIDCAQCGLSTQTSPRRVTEQLLFFRVRNSLVRIQNIHFNFDITTNNVI